MTLMDMPLNEALNTMTVGGLCEVLAGNLSIKDVAKLIGVSVSTVRRMIADGEIPDGENSIGRGGRRLWSYRSIQPAILQHQKRRH